MTTFPVARPAVYLPSGPAVGLLRAPRGGQDVDPAFIVTHNGEPVTHNGSLVTVNTDIDPAILVTHEGAVVTSGGQIVTHGG